MRVLVSGGEGSGSGYLATILREAGATVTHRAVPHIHDWRAALVERATFGPDRYDHIAVIIRGLSAHCDSMQERSGEYRQHGLSIGAYGSMVLATVADLMNDPRTVVVTYESLSHPAEVRALCRHLDLDPTRIVTRYDDANQARYAA